jgi:hypothetical protein
MFKGNEMKILQLFENQDGSLLGKTVSSKIISANTKNEKWER